MKKLLLIAITNLLIINSFPFKIFAQEATGPEGSWYGILNIQGVELKIAFHVKKGESGYTADMDSPDQSAFVIFFKQKTAYDLTTRDWSADVCSSDLLDLVKNNAAECEKSLKRASDRMGSDISGLYGRELALKQELAVLYLEKERVEKQIVEDAPAANEEKKVPQPAAAAPETAETQLAEPAGQNPPAAAVDISSLAFAWPLKSSKSVLSFYGTQKEPKYNVSYFNSGIDITGAWGEEVVAAADGKVKYKGEMKSVGKLLIIDHGGNITTLYSHLGVIEVGMGQKIGRGETIGRLTEKSGTGPEKPLLHFEIRINGGAKDPMDYL